MTLIEIEFYDLNGKAVTSKKVLIGQDFAGHVGSQGSDK